MISTKAVANSLLAPGIQSSPQLLFAAAQIQVFGQMKTPTIRLHQKTSSVQFKLHSVVVSVDNLDSQQEKIFLSDFILERQLLPLNIHFFPLLANIGLAGSRVAEVVRRHEGPSPKSLDSDKKFKP